MKLLTNDNEEKIQDELINIIKNSKSLKILSPYLTKTDALSEILSRKDFKLTLILDLDPKYLLKNNLSVDINLIKKIFEAGHNILYNPRVHSKMYMSSDKVILGSANFTYSGLEDRLESAILFEKSENPKMYKDCSLYFDNVYKKSTLITKDLIDKIIKIYNNNDTNDDYKNEELEEIISPVYSEFSVYNSYDLKYEYPKSLKELQSDLEFTFVDYESLEEKYKELKSEKKSKDEVIEFIRENLFIKNKGYNTITKINGKTSLIYRWYKHNEKFCDFRLKPYKDFYNDRCLELLQLYHKSYDIEPVRGFFANKFTYLKSKYLINDDIFSITFADFTEEWNFESLKLKLEEIDNFYQKKGKVPRRSARNMVKIMTKNGTITKDKEDKLRYEGGLRDKMYFLGKKYKNGTLDNEQHKELVEEYFSKWGWTTEENQ